MNNEKFRNYFRDLIYLMKEQQSEFDNEKNDDFNNGIKYGYSVILELFESQAAVFQIELSELGFNDFENFSDKK